MNSGQEGVMTFVRSFLHYSRRIILKKMQGFFAITVRLCLISSLTSLQTDGRTGLITRERSPAIRLMDLRATYLDLYAATDIPETEGTEILRMKFGTSAANVSGKKFASAEAATWLGEHFSSTLSDVKKAVDQFFIAGVNHIFYHGTCYSPQNEPWPGFLFYAAVEFTPVNSFWNDFPILNNYIAHVQSFTQKTKPDNDILLYFPIFDRFSDYNNAMLEHFDAISPDMMEHLLKYQPRLWWKRATH